LKLRQKPVQTPEVQPIAQSGSSNSTSTPDNSKRLEVAANNTQLVVPQPVRSAAPVSRNTSRTAASTPRMITANHTVKLLPGERSYLQAIAKLDTTINSNKTAMRPSLQVEYERNLAVVDRAIAATRNAAKSNPSDPDAADFMFAAYQSKVDLLNTIADARLSGGRTH